MLSLASPVFVHGAPIPSRFTCEGENVSPALTIGGVPQAAKSLALVMDDPDVPKVLKADGVFDHWVLGNIPPQTTEIKEGENIGVIGSNSRGRLGYTGPCPPKEYEPSEHRYSFRLYALDTMLNIQSGVAKQELEAAMVGHIIEQAELLGRYHKQK